MLRPATSLRSLAGATAGVAVASLLLAVPAHAAPVAPTPGAAVSASTSVRIVTPPTRVSRSALARLLRHAGTVTDKALLAGAKVRTSITLPGITATTLVRTRDGISSSRTPMGFRLLTDYRAGVGYVPISEFLQGIDPAALAAALDSLGRPGASWATLKSTPADLAATDDAMVRIARAASDWRWKRTAGITTWRLRVDDKDPVAIVVGLDQRQRIVRQSLSAKASKRVPFATRFSTTTRYGAVTPIVLPRPDQTVDLLELFLALASGQDDTVDRGTAIRVSYLETQIQALRTLSGR